MTAADRQAALSEALRGRVVRDAFDVAVIDTQGAAELAAALLPVVDRLCREAAAEALREADVPGLAKSWAQRCVAEAFEAAADEWPDAYASSVSDWLRDRAAALAATEGEK